MSYLKNKFSKALKRLFKTSNPEQYLEGDVADRIVALRYACLRKRRIDQEAAVEVVRDAIDRYRYLARQNIIAKRQFIALEAFANNKIAEHQGVLVVSTSLNIYSMHSIDFNPCLTGWCMKALIGVNRSDYLRSRMNNAKDLR